MNLGTIFSICAGILIGLKLYYRYFQGKVKKKMTYTELESKNQKRMRELIEQQKYGVVFLRNGEHIVELKNGKYILIREEPTSRRFWHDLWYGSGWG